MIIKLRLLIFALVIVTTAYAQTPFGPEVTIDANTGQNAMTQAIKFSNYIPIAGIILTKMDGTAKGGIAIPIMLELGLPVYFMGVGEQADDLIPFNQKSYLKGLIPEKDTIEA